jgi:hypothetical protein
MKNHLTEEKKQSENLNGQIKECESSVAKLNKSIDVLKKKKDGLVVKAEEARESLESQQRQLQGLSAGIAENGSKSLSDSLLEMKARAQETTTSAKQAGIIS